jgi:ferrous iron transport protein A
MSDRKLVTLRQMGAGQSGKVVQIQGGQGLINRLGAIGLRPGKRITKVSSMLMRGPVTIQSGSTRMAIGFGMANRIIVELEEP